MSFHYNSNFADDKSPMSKKKSPDKPQPEAGPRFSDLDEDLKNEGYRAWIEEQMSIDEDYSDMVGDLPGLGRRVVKARKNKGWDQKMLALWTGIPAPTLSKIENGHRYPNTKQMISLAGALGLSLDFLVGRDTRGAPTFTATPEIPPPPRATFEHALMLHNLLGEVLVKTRAVGWEEEPAPPADLPPGDEDPRPDDK